MFVFALFIFCFEKILSGHFSTASLDELFDGYFLCLSEDLLISKEFMLMDGM